MKRQTWRIVVTDHTKPNDVPVAELVAYAKNSAIRLSEKAMGDIARDNHEYLYGANPESGPGFYTRSWANLNTNNPTILDVTITKDED